ncbi:MAG: hypothetical protein H7263_10825 [Candidatus Sericytochromatia bacterium]|nr:hypothetical protein [Candidatus Sericytochromatia bacterium]
MKKIKSIFKKLNSYFSNDKQVVIKLSNQQRKYNPFKKEFVKIKVRKDK